MAIFSALFGSINPPLPKFESLDEGIDYLMDYLGEYSSSLSDKDLYTNKRWMEVRDDPHFQEIVLHVFAESGTYQHILNGDISEGSWKLDLGGFVWKFGGRHELYQLVFLNENFFILRKHGKQERAPRKYLIFASEGLARGKDWPDLLDILYELYKGNSSFTLLVFLLIFAIGIVLFLSAG